MSARKLWWARLRSSSPRYGVWRDILGTDEVPVKSPQIVRAELGKQPDDVYELDLAQLNAEQRRRLVDFIVRKFGESRAEVERELDFTGFPIREADVSVAFDMRAFL